MTGELAWRVAGTVDAMEALAPKWSALVRRDPTSTPFQHPGWLIPWWTHLGRDRLAVLHGWIGDRLVAVLPLCQSGGRWMPAGAGTSDYLGGVFDPDTAPEAVDSLGAMLARLMAPGERLDLFQLRSDSPLRRLDLPGSLRSEDASDACLSVPLPAEWGEYAGSLSTRFASNLRRAWRRAARGHDLDVVRPENGASVDLFDEMAELHRAEWRMRGEGGVLEDGAVCQAHRASIARLAADGMVWLLGVRTGKRLIAAIYGFVDPKRAERRAYSYLCGFDPNAASLSPGSLAVQTAIERAIDERCAVFDFLRGGEAYKRLWGAIAEPTHALTLAPRVS